MAAKAEVKDPTTDLEEKEVTTVTDAVESLELPSESETESEAEEAVEEDPLGDVAEEFAVLSTSCEACGADTQTYVLAMDLPGMGDKFFTKCKCATCGHASTGELSRNSFKQMGRKIQLSLCDESDWREREVLKSNTCVYSVPEIGLTYAKTTGPISMTVEMVLNMTRIEIQKHPAFKDGDVGEDKTTAEGLVKLMAFVQDLDEVISGEKEATFVIEDETGPNVCVSSPFEEGKDEWLKVER